MSRIFARDVRDLVKDELDSNLTAKITEINSERTETTATPVRISTDDLKHQYPEVNIEIDAESQFTSFGEPPYMDLTYDTSSEIFNVVVTVYHKGNDGNLENDIENYIQAFLELLHTKKMNSVTYIRAISSFRLDIEKANNYTQRVGGVKFECRIN